MNDDSYSPVDSAFRQYLEMSFARGLSNEKISLLRDAFFAGANTIRDIVQNLPAATNLAFEELEDHGTERERRDPCG